MNLIPWLVVAYAVICAVVYFGNRLFMYFPDPARIAPAEAGLDGSRRSSSPPTMASRWLPGTRRRGKTSRPSSISTVIEPMPPVAHPRLGRQDRLPRSCWKLIEEHGGWPGRLLSRKTRR